MRAVGWANVADSDLIFDSISFRYSWEPAKQDNIFRVYLSTKLSQKCLRQKDKNNIRNMVSGGFCNFRWM